MRRENAGFSLIEILIVITIIAGLMGLVVALIKPSTDKQNQVITTTRIGQLCASLETLRSPQVLAMYPPADPTQLRGPKGEKVGAGLGMPNDTNLGVESIYVALHLTTVSVRLEEQDDWLGNLDEDMMATNPTRAAKNDLFEYVDAWGNPFAYFTVREYNNPGPVSKIRMADGQIVTVHPWVSEKMGTPINQGTYQLFSAGRDGEFNTPDDVGNW